jgi:hypothetical protein
VPSPDVHGLWRRAQHGWPARFPLVQFPNAPLLVALAGWAVARVTSGDVHDAARAVFLLALAIWAYEELARGTNWLRRLLGAAVLVSLVVQVAGLVSTG